jgi:hypothetical protein
MHLGDINDEVLPDGWITLPLSELFFYPTDDIVDGPFGSNLKTSDYTNSGVPILRIQNIEAAGLRVQQLSTFPFETIILLWIFEAPQTKEVWYYDFRTNVHFTLRKNPLKYRDLQDFVNCYNSKYRSKHSSAWSSKKSDGRWRKFTYDELVARDKTSLDIFWLRDESLYDLDNPPEPDVLAAEIIENLEAWSGPK